MPDDIENEQEETSHVVLIKDNNTEPFVCVEPPPLEKMAPVEPNIIPHDVALKALLDALRMNG